MSNSDGGMCCVFGNIIPLVLHLQSSDLKRLASYIIVAFDFGHYTLLSHHNCISQT